jgi:fructose-1,6-bisphosphatase/inositol monophosphatase family enzyme
VGQSGVFATRNNIPVRTRERADLAAAPATCSNPDFFLTEEHARFTSVRDSVRYTLYGASSYAYGMLAAGRTDLAVDSGLKAYDVFAPAAVVDGAGGIVTEWTGTELHLGSQSRILAAGDPVLHKTALTLLNESRPRSSRLAGRS